MIRISIASTNRDLPTNDWHILATICIILFLESLYQYYINIWPFERLLHASTS